jgi:hypothetical protein
MILRLRTMMLIIMELVLMEKPHIMQTMMAPTTIISNKVTMMTPIHTINMTRTTITKITTSSTTNKMINITTMEEQQPRSTTTIIQTTMPTPIITE